MILSALAVTQAQFARFVACGLVLACIILFFYNFPASPSTTWNLKLPYGSGLSRSSNVLDDAMNRTLGFQKIFVINLPFRSDHRDSTSLAASFSGLDIEYVDGITEYNEKARPPTEPPTYSPLETQWRALRAHLNIARRMVEQNISTALVMEDDADWDIHIKAQMRQFAQASQLLVQPLPGTDDQYLDPTSPRSSPKDTVPVDLTLASGPITASITSPYGDVDRWDLFWLGHCGARWANPEEEPLNPLGRVVIRDDRSVPETQHLSFQTGDDYLPDLYPNHTRVIHSGSGNTCSFAYAMTMAAAQSLLLQFGIEHVDGAFDMMLPDVCVGRHGRRRLRCLTVQPALMEHHRPRGSTAKWSQVQDFDGSETGHGAFHAVASTQNIRWSTKVNLPKLVAGETDWIDQFPDGEQRPDIGY